LALSGMTDTAKVLGFLDLFGTWVPDLMFVLGGAVAVTVIGFRFVLPRGQPLLGSKFYLPTNAGIDGQLLLGAGLFGVGWGIYGYCPGPALSALVYLDMKTFGFVAAMFAGMALAHATTNFKILPPFLQTGR
jgi:uncharacterized membrane protein YedE/YeeE